MNYRLHAMLWIVAVAACASAAENDAWRLPNFAYRLEAHVSNPGSEAVQTLAVVPAADVRQVAPRFPGTLAIAVALDPFEVLPSQADDLDGDGVADEFVFSVSLAPGQSRAIHIYYSTTLHDTIPYPKHVHASHSFGFNTSTAALESEEIGYRMYGGFFLDVQARIKGLPGLNNALVGYLGSGAPSPAGRDIIHIGDTLGLGGIFVRRGDVVYRPPMNVPDYAHLPQPAGAPSYRVIAAGPLRAIIEARLDRWKIGDDLVDARALYTIRAGESAVACKLTITPVRMASGAWEVGVGIRHLPALATDDANGRVALSGVQEPAVGKLALAAYYDAGSLPRRERLVTPDGPNECIVFGQSLSAGRGFEARYGMAAAWSGTGRADLFGTLREAERQYRAVVTTGEYRFTQTPQAERLEGEAY